MKTIIMLLLLAASMAGWTQGRYTATSGGTVLLDTSTVGTQKFLYSPVFAPARQTHSIQYTGTKISGFAKGSVSLWATIDGTYWQLAANDSLSLVNGLSYTWDVANKLRRQFRVRIVAVDSTQSIQNKVSYLTTQ